MKVCKNQTYPDRLDLLQVSSSTRDHLVDGLKMKLYSLEKDEPGVINYLGTEYDFQMEIAEIKALIKVLGV